MSDDRDILSNAPIAVTLNGAVHEVRAPTRRRSWPLLAQVMRVAGKLSSLNLPPDPSAITPHQAAEMFDAFEPVCALIAEAGRDIPETDIDNASETELLTALAAIKEMLERPFVQPLRSGPNASATPRSNTSGDSATSTGSPGPTS